MRNWQAPGDRELLLSLLSAPTPGLLLKEALARGRLAKMPFLNLAPQIPAGPVPFHKGSVLGHLARCMDAVAGDPLAAWMALCHDAGKLTSPRHMWPHHYGHELRGAALAPVWAKALDLPAAYAEAGRMAALMHMRGPRYPVMRPGKRLSLLQAIFDNPYASQLLRVMDADSRSSISQLLISHWQQISALGSDRDSQLRLLASLRMGGKDIKKPAITMLNSCKAMGQDKMAAHQKNDFTK